MNLKQSIIRVFSANLIQVTCLVLVGFITPLILSLDDFAYLKTYSFFISYIGLLHLGFVDGIYIRYGGKKLNSLNPQTIVAEHNFFLLTQLIVTIFLLIISLIIKDFMWFVIALSIVPFNLTTYYKRLTQSTGEFKNYSRYMYIYNSFYLFLNLFLVFIYKSTDYRIYCFAMVVSNLLVVVVAEFNFWKVNKGVKPIYNNSLLENISIGFLVLLGNISVNLLYAIDRWFVKIFMNNDSFAYYSFAVSMLNIVTVLVSSVAITFYNFLSKEVSNERIKSMKNHLLILGGGTSLCFFLLSGVVVTFLEKYTPSLKVIAFSVASFPYYIVITSIYLNLYKSRLSEKKYFKVVILMVVLSILLNCVAILFNSISVIAIATAVTYITWYFYSLKDFKFLKPNKRELLYLLIVTASFTLLSNLTIWYIGLLIYLLIYIISVRIFYDLEYKEYVLNSSNIYNRIKQKFGYKEVKNEIGK